MSKLNQYNYERARDQKLAESICVSATVRVIKFDKEKMTVNVQPLSKHLENGSFESQPPILCVPVAVTRIGGYIIRPWIKEGDVGVVVYLDHDSDATVSGGKEARPQTTRNHSTGDAIFIGGIVSGGYTVKGLPDDALVLAKEDGSSYVSLEQDKIAIKNKGTTAEFTADKISMNTGEVSINASGAITLNGSSINLN